MGAQRERRLLARSKQGVDKFIQIEASALEIMPCPLDDDQLFFRWDQIKRRTHLSKRAEGIGRTMYENRAGRQRRKMRYAQLSGLAGRMQRVRQQEQSLRQLRLIGRQHAGLPAAVGMAAQIDMPRNDRAQSVNRLLQARAIGGGAPRRRRPTALPAKGQIASQDNQAGGVKRLGRRHKQGRVAVSARAMREDQAVVSVGRLWMEKAANALFVE